MKTKISMISLMLAMGIHASAQTEEGIRLNQVGMYPQQEKIAVLEPGIAAKGLSIRDAVTGKKVSSAKKIRTSVSPWSGKKRTIVDFSRLTTPGKYVFEANGHRKNFEISEKALTEVTRGTLKAFYLVRSGMPIEEQYAGIFKRPLGHSDTKVFIHPSAASLGRPSGSIISSPLGWYDAGDYNKYVVNSSFSMGIMLCSYEQCPDYYRLLATNIPESGNKLPDLLDEIIYNMKWLFTMQDPYDGGVYHKLTTPNFEGFISPGECKQPRYVVQKSVTGTYDFAAVMAQMARILKKEKCDCQEINSLIERAERAAMAAYHWAESNPKAFYEQNEMNKKFQPAVSTGTYGDGHADDEHFWAATELYLLTGDETFLKTAESLAPKQFSLPTWGNVISLGVFEWLTYPEKCPALTATCKQQLLTYCDKAIATTATSSFQTAAGNNAHDFGWGCLAEAFCTSGLSNLYAYQLTGNQKYLTAANQSADYLMGRNATGYCYVTGYGEKSPMFPHHRVSAADGIEQPMPGLLVGGPNPGQQDNGAGNIKYPSKQPDESYADSTDSYASNEIAINWNASLLAMFGWLDAVMQGK